MSGTDIECLSALSRSLWVVFLAGVWWVWRCIVGCIVCVLLALYHLCMSGIERKPRRPDVFARAIATVGREYETIDDRGGTKATALLVPHLRPIYRNLQAGETSRVSIRWQLLSLLHSALRLTQKMQKVPT